MKELIDNVLNWADERNLLRPECAEKQYLKFLEEVGETARAILKNNKNEIIDGFGDIAVTVIILSSQLKKTQHFFLNEKRGFYLDFSKLLSQVSSQHIDTLCLDTLIMTARGYGYDIEECLQSAWNEIKDRKGKTINGTFIKESDLTAELLEEFLP